MYYSGGFEVLDLISFKFHWLMCALLLLILFFIHYVTQNHHEKEFKTKICSLINDIYLLTEDFGQNDFSKIWVIFMWKYTLLSLNSIQCLELTTS